MDQDDTKVVNVAGSGGNGTKKSLEEIFGELRLSFSSVGDDIGQIYVVDGDSLLLDVFSHPLLDWSYGGQLLQFFYQAECALQKCAHRGRIFKIVFFDCFGAIWKDESLQFCREMFIEHVKTETKIDVERFQSWESKAWKEFVDFTRPSFMLLMNPKSASMAVEKMKKSLDDPSTIIRKMVVDLICKQNMECVSMSEVSYKSSSMFGFRFVAPREIRNEAAVTEYKLEVSKSYLSAKGKLENSLAEEIKGLKLHESSIQGLSACIYTLVCVLRDSKADATVSLAKTFLLHSLACRTIPLRARAQNVPSPNEMSQTRDFLHAIYITAMNSGLSEMIARLDWTGIWRCDFLDARLFCKIAVMSSNSTVKSVEELGLSSKLESNLEEIWKFIASAAKLGKGYESYFPIWKKSPFTKLASFMAAESKVIATRIAKAEKVEVILNGTREEEIKESVDALKPEKVETEKDEVPDAWDAEDGDGDDDVADAWDADDGDEAEADEKDGNEESGTAGGASEELITGLDSAKKVDVILHRESVEDFKITRFNSNMVKDFAGDVELQIERRNAVTTKPPECPYNRDSVWLLDREIDDGTNPPPEPEPQTKYERRKATQRKARYIAYLDKYAKSLKGGGIIYRDVVVAQKSDTKSKPDPKTSKKGSKKASKKGGKGKKMGMREKIRMDVEKKQREKALDDVKCFIRHASSMKTLEKRIESLDNALMSRSEPYAVVPGLMQLLEWIIESWKLEKANGGMNGAVRVFQMVMDIFRRFKMDITLDQFKELQLVLLRLGFQDAAELFVDQFIRERPEKISRKDLQVEMPSTKELTVGIPSYRFQLMYAGHLMVRDVDSAFDDRVSGFYPDKWQRDLLDVVDKKESALVVAPTSSGKTFVSYYAMKQALFDNKTIKRSTDRSVIVYVSPTKALVNQVAADVYARYGAVFGVMTLDYSRRLKDCEVLITIPECLETLLLSPQSEVWTRCIKYVVFDEVHCLGSTKNGDVWERLLMMVKCPFIALSATLGNPQEFSEWLGRIQKTHDRKVNLIIHRTRWSDLIKYMYLPRNVPKLTALQGQKHIPSFEYVHPCSALGTELARTGFPPDLSFSPKDCMLLYDAMLTIKVPNDVQKRLDALHPLTFFKNLLYIKKVDAQKFEKALKDELYTWSASGMKKEILELVGRLTKGLDSGISEVEKNTKGMCYGTDYLKEFFMPLMVDLLNADFLPAVVFNLDREICEDLVTAMLFTLEAMEEQTLEAEGVNLKKKSKDMAKLAKQAKRKRDKEEKKKKDEEGDPGEDEDGAAPVEDEPLYHVDPRFSFIQDGQAMETGELEWWLDRLLYKTKWPRTHLLIRALQRGIGVHHDELERAYKDLVETLFRTKHLKVVVATSTLALGVNMPARTTVFCGDSPNLDPLQYRQMAGRAGRRGYDNIGNVVFVGIPPKKVFRLMTSSLVSLHGHFPMTPTVALRMVNHYGKVAAKENSKKMLINLLKEPFFKNREVISEQAKLHFRYSIQYLLEQDLIKYHAEKDFQVHGAGALAVHLRFAQPGNMVFVRLWDEGVFDNICSSFENKGEQQEILRKLMLVMAHIFFREPLPVGLTKEDLSEEVESKSNVILPKLPGKVQKLIDEQTKSALKIYSTYLKHAVLPAQESDPLSETEPLPISGIKTDNAACSPKTFLGKLSVARLPAIARSEYYRMSGSTDNFTSATEMCETVRPELCMDLEAIPVCEMKDHQLRSLPLNAYAVDFFRHGSLALLIRENGLTSAKAWALLKQWSYLLEDLAQGVSELQRPTEKEIEHAEYYGYEAVAEKNKTCKAFHTLNLQFQELFESWNKQQTNERKKMETLKKTEILQADD